jgi:energy-coupling factor transport system permease protein
MQWIASGFLFVRGRTAYHRLDPRVRLAISLSIFSVSLVSQSIIFLSVMVALVLGIVLFAKVLKRFAKSMVFTAIISLVAFALNYYFTPGSPHQAVVFGIRLFAVISSTSLFFMTTTPDELEQVMKWMRLPSDFIMIFVIAIRFVPVLMLDALQIMDAQRARGLEFDKGNFVKRLRNTIPVIIPLIAVALNRSLDLAEAMDSRAYGATKRPTSLYGLSLKTRDYATLGILTIGLSAAIYVTLFVAIF